MTDYIKSNIGSGYNAATNINTELGKIETAIASKVDEEGGVMTGDLQMNSNDILNAGQVSTNTLILDGVALTANNPINSDTTITTTRIVATAGQTVFTVPSYSLGINAIQVFLNGVKLSVATDYAETNTTTITLTNGASVNDVFEALIGSTVTDANNYDSALVTYTQGGTGAVNTNVKAKLQETVSVKDFGAVGDGVTDDFNAIKSAIDYLQNNGGGILDIGSSEYLINNGNGASGNFITISSDNVFIRGAGGSFYCTDNSGISTSVPFITFNNANNCGILGHVTFRGNEGARSDRLTAATADTYAIGLKIREGCTNIYIESIECRDFTGTGFSIGAQVGGTASKNIYVGNLLTYNCWNAGSAITNGQNVFIGNLEAYGCTSNGNFAECGHDLEVNDASDVVEGIYYGNVNVYDNKLNFQVLAKSDSQRGIHIEYLKARDPNNVASCVGISLVDARGITIDEVDIEDMTSAGVNCQSYLKDIKIKTGNISLCSKGVNAVMSASNTAASSEELDLGTTRIFNNDTHGVHVQGTATYPFLRFRFAGQAFDDRGGSATQTYGVLAASNTNNAICDTVEATGNTIAQVLVDEADSYAVQRKLLFDELIDLGTIAANTSANFAVANPLAEPTDFVGVSVESSSTGLIWSGYATSGNYVLRVANTTTSSIGPIGTKRVLFKVEKKPD